MTDRDGGPMPEVSFHFNGVTLRDYYRAHAPVTMADALSVYGKGTTVRFGYLTKPGRAAVFVLMSQLRDEYATAMLALDEKETTNER